MEKRQAHMCFFLIFTLLVVGCSNGSSTHIFYPGFETSLPTIEAVEYPSFRGKNNNKPYEVKIYLANLFYGKYACHAAQHGRRNRIRPGIFPKSKAHRGQAAGIDRNISFAIPCCHFARRKYIILKLRRGDCRSNSCFFKNKRILH